jgi:hypothetical protein
MAKFAFDFALRFAKDIPGNRARRTGRSRGSGAE